MAAFSLSKVENAFSALIENLENQQDVLFIPQLSKLRKNYPMMHYHTFPELFLQISANDLFVFPNEKKMILPGSACLVPRGLPHKEVVEKEKSSFENMVIRYIDDGIVIHFAKVNPEVTFPAIREYQIFYTEESYRTFQYLTDTIENFHAGFSVKHPLVKYPFLTAIHSLNRIISKTNNTESYVHHKISLCKGMILSQLGDHGLNIKTLAKKLGISSDYLGRLFQKEAGCSLNHYIQNQRILMARELLTKSELDINQVCHLTGFIDPSYFTKVFKKIAQINPKEYRKSLN